ncbi:MAG: glycosyltransferase [Clostridiales bacterium]|nr:glycosyltransferase [Clostridiales bacterium]
MDAKKDSAKKIKILFITAATHKKHMKNINHYQRVYFLSRWADLSILASKSSDFSLSAYRGTKIFRSFFSHKTASLIYFFWWILVKGCRGNYDIVITEPSIYSVCGFWAKIILNIKWVVDIWDIPIRCQSHLILLRLKTQAQRLFFKLIYQQADYFIVSILPDYELKKFGLPAEKMLLLKNAIWLKDLPQKKFHASSKWPFNLLCMRSGYSIDSGLDILSKAYRNICQDLNVSLTIVGKIPSKLRSQLDQLKGCPRVYYHDFIEHDRLLETISSASACIIPYKNVPDLAQIYPVKLLEYLALGAVIIASDIGGLARMIKHGWNGLLFRAGDSDDLARQISILYNDPALREKLSLNARDTINKEFDCEEKNRIILSNLEELIKKAESL